MYPRVPLPNRRLFWFLEREGRKAVQIVIKGRQMEVTPQLRQRIERKVQRLARLVDEQTRVEVTVAEEQTRSTRDRYSVQLALAVNSRPVRSEVSAVNASTALDLVIDKIVTQLGRQKDRQTTVKRHARAKVKVLSLARSGLLSVADDEQDTNGDMAFDSSVEEENNEAIWSRVLEIRSLPTSPMSDQEVIAQMEESGALFYPFFNEETKSVNVMYRLEQGGYGLLIPAVE